jgi:cytoskeletal protein CcmA (bactofilin family)
MAAKDKAEPVSGFDIVRAVKQVRDQHGSAPPPPRPPRAPPGKPPDQPPDDPKPKARIGKTAVPTKYEYTCHKCGYNFTIAGKVQTLYCAKCRTILNQSDYTIDKRHDVSIVTAGMVKIASNGIWAGDSLTAREVVLEGQHECGKIRATHRLVIGPGALPRMGDIEAQDIAITAEASLFMDAVAAYRNIEIAGEFIGELHASGLVTIRPGGHFKGKLVARHLVVEDGGGLSADVDLNPERTEQPPSKVETGSIP